MGGLSINFVHACIRDWRQSIKAKSNQVWSGVGVWVAWTQRHLWRVCSGKNYFSLFYVLSFFLSLPSLLSFSFFCGFSTKNLSSKSNSINCITCSQSRLSFWSLNFLYLVFLLYLESGQQSWGKWSRRGRGSKWRRWDSGATRPRTWAARWARAPTLTFFRTLFLLGLPTDNSGFSPILFCGQSDRSKRVCRVEIIEQEDELSFQKLNWTYTNDDFSKKTILFYLAQIIARRKTFWNLPVSMLLFVSRDVTVKVAMRTTKRRAGNTASMASNAPNRPMEDFPTLSSNFRILRNMLSSMLEPPLNWIRDHT